MINTQLNKVDYTDKRHTTSLVLDVETTLAENKEQTIFDIGWTISSVANQEIVIKRSFLVREIFTNYEMMKRAYYFNKYPLYLEKLNSQEIKLANFNEIIKVLNQDMIDFNVKEMYAYNSRFDSTAITKTNAYLNEHSHLEYEIKCLWLMASQTIMSSERFISTALLKNWKTDKGNIKTNAETVYKYMTGNDDFVEEHTGLSDSIIETEILWKIKSMSKKIDYELTTPPWLIVNELRETTGE